MYKTRFNARPLITVIISLCCLFSAHSFAKAKPNLIFILADDLGYGDIGVFGQTHFTTPHLDKMANEGIKFTNFYAGSAVCAPSRSVLLTGQHVGNTRIRSNAKEAIKNGKRVRIHNYLEDEDFTLAEMLKQADYKTAIIGKWGLGEPDNAGHPNKQGFDYFYGYLNHVHAHNHFPEFLWRNQEKVMLRNKVQKFKVNTPEGFPGTVATQKIDYADDLIRDEALAYIDKYKDQPFFLFLSFISPHANNEAKRAGLHGLEIPSYGEHADKDWPDAQKGYAAMVQHIDATVGAVLSKLKTLKIADNTIVMFSSDNGAHKEGGADPKFFNSSGQFSGHKRSATEGGYRELTIAWGPSIVPQGIVDNRMAYFGDVMATYADLAGLAIPDNLDSISFAPTLLGDTQKQKKHPYLYWEFYPSGSWQTVRLDNWKAIRKPLGIGAIKLYKINTDPTESKNVAKQYPEIVKKIEQIMEDNHTPSQNWLPRIKNKALKQKYYQKYGFKL